MGLRCSGPACRAFAKPGPSLPCPLSPSRLNVRFWPPLVAAATASHGTTEPVRGMEAGARDAWEAGARPMPPLAVILADKLHGLPREMRVGRGVIFTDLSSPEASRYVTRQPSFFNALTPSSADG